ncbi:MAG: hypothetical protein JXJ20_02500 [Anaerolineae bacterium]|nr:hypothetical protein [Anaerolineae bacterium]
MDYSLIIAWLGREGGDILTWWWLATLAGLAVWPLLYRVMGGLPDRGYTLARTAGLMLTGFVFWFLGSLGLLRNTVGGMVFAWLVVLAIGLVVFFNWDERPPVWDWLREHAALIIVTELLFAALLVGWAMYRAHNPEMRSTEKPMEIMFLNGIRRSEVFPPNDPWMSGYAISYYYFGYLIMAMLADLGSVGSGIAFNLTIALLFALAGIGALGVVYNLVRAHGARRVRQGAAIGAGMLGLCLLILMGNLGTALVEFPYNGYTPGLVNADYFDFWDVEDRAGTYTTVNEDGQVVTLPVDSDQDMVPNWDDDPKDLDEWSFTWGMGWRYSRTVQDRALPTEEYPDGEPIDVQPIAEFPNFSFVLADIHPHVLALPFALLAIGLALNLVLGGRDLLRWEYPLYAIWVGGMIFMNSWDAIYLPLLVGAEALRRMIRNGTGTLHLKDLGQMTLFALALGALTVLFYLPWLISFSSQAHGILPNVIFPTRWSQFFLQFGPFLVILTVFLAVELRRAGTRFNWQAGLLALAVIACAAVLATFVLGVSAWSDDGMRNAVWSIVNGSGGWRDVIPETLARRASALPSELLLLAMVYVVVGRLFAVPVPRQYGEAAQVTPRTNYSPATGFALLLVGAGAVLTFAPDFVYLHDNFSVRINTVFKLYYQGWILFSLAGAFAVWSVLAGKMPLPGTERGDKPAIQPGVLVGRVVYGLVVIVFVGAGLLYPVLATRGRALVDTGRLRKQDEIAACEAAGGTDCPTLPDLTLDGAAQMVSADEYAAIQCLDALEDGSDAVLVEAPGGAYAPDYSRFAGLTGIPTLIGWQNHERQWRGDTYPEVTDARVEDGQYRDRATDVQELYTTLDWEQAWYVIDRYGIDYIVVGSAERQMIRELASGNTNLQSQYGEGLRKFAQVFDPVCETGSAVVYRVSPQ